MSEDTFQQAIYVKDMWFYRGVVIVLGLAVVGSVVGLVFSSASQDFAKVALVAIGSGSIGALAGLFKCALDQRSRPESFSVHGQNVLKIERVGVGRRRLNPRRRRAAPRPTA